MLGFSINFAVLSKPIQSGFFDPKPRQPAKFAAAKLEFDTDHEDDQQRLYSSIDDRNLYK